MEYLGYLAMIFTAIAEKNIFVKGCDIWGNTVTYPEVWQEPLVVLEPKDSFYVCTRQHTN